MKLGSSRLKVSVASPPLGLFLPAARHISLLLYPKTRDARDQSSVHSTIGIIPVGRRFYHRTLRPCFPSHREIRFARPSCMREKCRRQAKYVRTTHRFDLRPRDASPVAEIIYTQRHVILQNVTIFLISHGGDAGSKFKYETSRDLPDGRVYVLTKMMTRVYNGKRAPGTPRTYREQVFAAGTSIIGMRSTF